jgi:hypothetical protein
LFEIFAWVDPVAEKPTRSTLSVNLVEFAKVGDVPLVEAYISCVINFELFANAIAVIRVRTAAAKNILYFFMT